MPDSSQRSQTINKNATISIFVSIFHTCQGDVEDEQREGREVRENLADLLRCALPAVEEKARREGGTACRYSPQRENQKQLDVAKPIGFGCWKHAKFSKTLLCIVLYNHIVTDGVWCQRWLNQNKQFIILHPNHVVNPSIVLKYKELNKQLECCQPFFRWCYQYIRAKTKEIFHWQAWNGNCL